MRLSRTSKCRKGAILLEALLSIVILSVSVVLINQSLTASLRSLVFSEEYSRALVFLENELFDFMYLGSVEDNQHKEFALTKDDRFNVEMNTQSKKVGDDSTLHQLDLKIAWKSGKRKNNIFIETYLFPPSDEKE